MISVRIPEEIRKYKEKIICGLHFRQLVGVVAACGICIPFYIWGKKYISEELVSWIVMFIAVPSVCFGFFKFHGMTFEKFVVVGFKQYFLFPNKRTFKSENFFREVQNQAIAEERKNIPKKLRFQASLERTYLMAEAEENGLEIDMDTINENLLTVRNGGGGNKNNKEPKKKDENKKDNKVVKMSSKLETKVQAIYQKQKDDPRYLPNSSEGKILQIYLALKEKERKTEIKKGMRTVSKKNKKMELRRKAKTFIPTSTQHSLPYVADYEEGLFEVEPNKYSKVIKIQDINYLVAKEEEQVAIFCKFGEFLNYFSEDMNISVCIDNHVVSPNEQERNVLYPLKGDKYDKHRKEYNKILKRQIVAGKNDILQSKYITVTIDCDTPYEAILRFHKIEAEVLTNLKKIGSRGYVLSTDERLSMIHDKMRKGREGEFQIDYDFIKEQGISSKDYVAPSSFRFDNKHFMIEDEYYRCMYLNNLPSSLQDDFLSEIVDCEFPLITTLNIQPVAQDKGLRIVKKQLTGMEGNKIEAEKKALRAGYSPETISHDLKQSLSQAVELLDDMKNKNQKMFFVTITVMVNGKTLDELEENCKILCNKARKFTAQFQNFYLQQEEAFKITLPMGYPPKKILVDRSLTTESTAIFIPFTSQELFQPGGFYYGLNQITRNLIICNRTSMKTPSGFILGSSGSGKSFATKREMLNVLLNDDLTGLLVIDPENEYGDFARAFGGTVILISTDSDNHINFMDMSLEYGLDDKDDSKTIDLSAKKTKAIKKKSEYIMSIVQAMVSMGKYNDSIMTPTQKTIVDRCVIRAYKEYFDHDFEPEYLPTPMQLQDEFDKEKNSSNDGKTIADSVEYYTRGSMNLFSHATNVNYDNRFVVFSIRDLGDQLKQIALLIVLDFIWNRMISNKDKGIRTYCYCDEIHTLFYNEYSARFLQQLYKRGRKYGLVITGITQNMEDLLKSDMARGMIGNSDFIMMLNQASEDLKLLASMLHISDAQMQYVSRADAGGGLLFAEKTIVPFLDEFPKDSYLYTLMSTTFGEDKNNNSIEEFISTIMETQAEEDRIREEAENNRLVFTVQKEG